MTTFDCRCRSFESNINEVNGALFSYQRKKTQRLDLYATSETDVSYQGTWMGKFWKGLDKYQRWGHNNFTEWDVGETLKHIIQVQFNKAIRDIYRLRTCLIANHVRMLEKELRMDRSTTLVNFERNLVQNCKIKPLNEEYARLFHERLNSELTADDLGSIRKSVVHFFSGAEVLWSIILIPHPDHEALREPLTPFLNRENELFADNALYISLFIMSMCVDLERRLRQPLPVVELAKVICQKDLSLQETEQLNEWIEGLNQNKDKINIRQFQCVLREIANVITLVIKIDQCYEKILFVLDKKGCRLMSDADPVYLDGEEIPNPDLFKDGNVFKGRENLNPGDKIKCNGVEYVLGKLLSPDKIVDDQNKVFALADHPDAVVKFSNNPFRLHIEAIREKDPDEHWGIHPVSTTLGGLDRLGTCMILEKLETPLSSYKWESDSPQLNEKDRRIALILANHIICCREGKVSLSGLSLNHLMSDEQGVLKTLRLLKKEEPNYNQLVDWCWQAAKNNKHMFSFLIRVTKLYDDEIAKIYRTALSKFIENDYMDNFTDQGKKKLLLDKKLYSPPANLDEKYHSRYTELQIKSLEICKKILVLVVTHLKEPDDSSQEQEVKKTISIKLKKKKPYDSSQEPKIKNTISLKLSALYCLSPGGMLPDSFVEEIADEIINTNLTTDAYEAKLIEAFNDLGGYYKEQSKELRKREAAAKAQQLALSSIRNIEAPCQRLLNSPSQESLR